MAAQHKECADSEMTSLTLCGRHTGSTQGNPRSLPQPREAAAGEDEEAGGARPGAESGDEEALGVRQAAGCRRRMGPGGARGRTQATARHPERTEVQHGRRSGDQDQ